MLENPYLAMKGGTIHPPDKSGGLLYPSTPRYKIILLLRSFSDALQNNFKGKNFTYRIEPLKPVPEKSMRLWKSRGYVPSGTGVAYVRFEDAGKEEYTYPAYFWSE